jgi:hypothetical protein
VMVPHGGAVLILTASEVRAQSSSRSCSAEHDAPWTRGEVFALARRMVHELHDGLSRAARYLRALGVELEEALQALFPGRAVTQ